jgi:hypothetical protein
METAKIEWAHNRPVYEMHKNVNAALISVFRQAINPEVIADVETDPQIHQVTNFLTYFDQFMRAYSRTDALATKKLHEDMKEPWDPTTMEFSKLVRQLRDGMRFAQYQYIDTLITAERALQMAELLILKCGHMKTKYSMWKTLLPQDRTFTNFCNWWKEKYAIWKTTHQAASSFGYGGSATQVEDEIDTINAATNAANAATFQQLMQSNNALAQQLQALQLTNAQLMQQVAAAAQAPVMPPLINYQPPQPIVQPMPTQQYVQLPQHYIAPQVQQQPYQQQYHPQQYGGRGGGRGGGRTVVSVFMSLRFLLIPV